MVQESNEGFVRLLKNDLEHVKEPYIQRLE